MGQKIVITTYGSLGDIHPYIAIALELKKRGHQPVMAMGESFRQKFQKEGLEFHPIRPDALLNLIQDLSLIEALRQSQRESEYAISYALMPHIRATYYDLKEAVKGASLLISHHLSFAASLLVETTNINWVSTVLSPISFLSAYPSLPYNAVKNSPYEVALQQVAAESILRNIRYQGRFWSAPCRQFREELGLKEGFDPVFEGQHSPQLVLALFSQFFAQRKPDWPRQTKLTGFPFFDRHDNKFLSSEIQQFLAAGKPPIIFTLGSLFVGTPGNFYMEGAKAVAKLGYRAILLMGQGAYQISPNNIPDGVMVADYAPYSQIFPHAAAIVHHGGVGTTGQSLLAGKPVLVVPYAHDQPDNATRLVNLGVGRSLTREEYSCDRLVWELKELLLNPSYQQKATEVSRLMQQEDGVKNACDAIEKLLVKS
ncbi:glycosyltransferase [Crocosphaera sp. Alani8]|uniref:glycosyltransferase n=1 Tax=Crocosphaera sp. Alani8 TaxID=3038952 RepID=UPI00313CA6DB